MPCAVQVGHIIGALGRGALALAGVVEGLCPTCGQDMSGCELAQPAPWGSQTPLSQTRGARQQQSLLQHPAGEGRRAWHCPAWDGLAESCAMGLMAGGDAGALTETQALELRQGG